jgi:outer membrane protein assembly factor BamB
MKRQLTAARAFAAAGVCATTATALALTAMNGSAQTARGATRQAVSATLPSTWTMPGANLANTRDVGGPINASNVATLGTAWSDQINVNSPYGGYTSTPVVSGNVVYTQDLESNVEAINLQTGAIIWTKAFSSFDEGPNGLTLGNGDVFGATATSAFALDASTGRQLWIKKLTRNRAEGIDMAPAYHDGTVYVSTVSLNAGANLKYTGGGQGILWALNAATGAKRWEWHSIPTDGWSAAHERLNGGGGLWEPPSFDGHGGLYLGTANPEPFPGTAQYPWGSSRPGPDLYTDCIVKLSAKTGKLIWYYQLTPHDIYDWDMQNSPILSRVHGRQIVIDGGKAGIIVALDAATGKLLWKRPVGIHDGHTSDGLLAESGDFSKLSTGWVEPGPLGGIESVLASNGSTVFAAVNDMPGLVSLSRIIVPVFSESGDLVAVNEATGRVRWDVSLPQSPYGGVTIVNNVVFTTTYDGRLWAFNAANGRQLWSTYLPFGTNAPVSVVGDTVLTAASIPPPSSKGSIVAFRLGAIGASGPAGASG